MMKMNTYPCQSSRTYLILLVFAALTVFGYAEYNGDIALDRQNLVKVYYNGKWGTIVKRSTYTIESKVICRSLGLKYSYHGYRYSSIPAYMSYSLACRGDEKSLLDCYGAYMSSYNYYSSSQKLYVRCNTHRTETYCSFDNNMCGMVTEGSNNYIWKRIYPRAQSGQSGLKSDHTTKNGAGKYMLAHTVGLPGQETYLKTKSFYSSRSVSFYYNMFGKEMGSLNIYIQSNSLKSKIHSIADNQSDGWKYICIPVAVKYGYHQIIFEAVHGKGLISDIALDDVTISSKDCSNWNVSCNFNEDTCNYDIENDYIRRGWRIQKISGLNDNSTDGDYLVHNGYYSNVKNSLISPLISIPQVKAKVTFHYYMPGTGNSELQVRFVEERFKTWFIKTPYFWQDAGNHGSNWQYGCIDLPSRTGRIVFTGISRHSRYASMALDDIVVDKGYCQTGITNHVCTFDNPLLCEYTINCMNTNEYTWRRNIGKTSSSGTGPNADASNSQSGYYMYAEASYGMPNDTTQLKFEVSNVKRKHLKFSYHMYGSGVGQLYVVFNTKLSNETIVWTMKGNKGSNWHKVCILIEYDISDITFIAKRGYSYQGDIAIDSVSIEKRPCPGPFDCDFENGGLCSYKVFNNALRWRMYNQYSYSRDTNSYLYVYSYTNTENIMFQMWSPQAFVVANSSVSFKYRMTGYMKEFAVFTYDSYSKNKSWSSNYNDITEFTSACVDFPYSKNVRLIFQVTAKTNSYSKAHFYLDDIAISNETCRPVGIDYHFCKFKEVHLCNYHVECPENTKYNWSRGSFSRYYNIRRPANYSYRSEEYFMRADSSFGRTGDKTQLVFSNVRPPSGSSLYFSYYLPKDSGNLQLHLENWNGNKLMFQEFSDFGLSWQSVCVNVTNDTVTNFVFTATKGIAFVEDIALMDVGFKQGDCQARSISCDFSNDMICQYGINHYYYNQWERIYSGNVSNSTNGFYMQTIPGYYEKVLVSPSENLTNSCVQIRYKIINKNCNLTIYNAFNKNLILSTVSDDTTQWEIAQIYIQKEATRLVFLAKDLFSWRGTCTILLDSVKVTENNCTELVCRAGTRKCKNNYCYSESKVCDKINDCSDGSDEENCPTSIPCSFETKYGCGYKIVNGWKHNVNKIAPTDVPGSMQIVATKGELISPYATLAYSCVNFKFITHTALTGNFSIILNHLNSTGGVSHSLMWNEIFFHQKDGSYEGQFQFPAGAGFLEFRANIRSGGLAIDEITVLNGTCPELNCSKNSHKCSDNTKCINENNICNNYRNCKSGSDEESCPKFFTCDFEDTNMCGFKSYPEADSWILNNGVSGKRPKLDHSERTFEGHYVMSTPSGEIRLELPKITTENTFCLNFYYTFYGDGNVSVYDNKAFLMGLSKYDVDIWRNVNITLSKGNHDIYYIYSNGNDTGTVAFDSVSIIRGSCSHRGCEENWYPCNDNRTCFAYTDKCDGINNCPEGEDEYNCTSKQEPYKLFGGRSLQSGSVEMLYGSRYLPVCSSYYSEQGVKDICSQLGFNGTVTKQRKTLYVKGDYLSCRYYYSPMRCYKYSCSYSCYCNSLYVTCSNTTCKDGMVKCPPGRNETNSTDVCIRRESLCDGEIDCEDGTDEENCDRCTDEQWQCRNKKCINKDLYCNGVKDCDDGSDEFHCFRYVNDTTIQVFYNGSYTNICENNLKKEIVAKYLCSSVGRSNGTFDNPVKRDGVLFISTFSNRDSQLIPGFEAKSFEQCDTMTLKCSKQLCGIRKVDLIEPNIQNGQSAFSGKWPWTVQIYRDSSLICTGILISSNVVLTAAHCVSSYYRVTYYIRTGSIKRFTGEIYTVTQFRKHDDYISYNKGNDIALLYVKSGIKMSSTVQPICLPENPVPEDKECYVAGWGRTEDGCHSPVIRMNEGKMACLRAICDRSQRITGVWLTNKNKKQNPSTLDTRNQSMGNSWYNSWFIFPCCICVLIIIFCSAISKNPTVLQDAKVHLIDGTYCNKYYPYYYSNTTFCANNKEDKQPTCYGDSGGPLACRNIQGNWVAYGVTSYGGYGCAGSDSSPSVFTDVYKMMSWITANI